ncbi:SSI family serine proteinase inhibitor [Streptomyces sp. NPDC051561]|uniref:SSI family serine proteinase inhibitor n=1 Tax=Streptomyces sp. NPDC051561 TaxID=3365658 RepID=UPI003787D4B6
MAAVRTAVRKALVATVAAAALLAGAGGATAQTVPAAPSASTAPASLGNWMYVVVIEGEDVAGDMKGTVLRCPGPRKQSVVKDGHQATMTACTQLDAVDGDISKIKRADVACPMIYKPVTALSYGMWDGRRMAFAKTFPNECVMQASTGSVFKLA